MHEGVSSRAPAEALDGITGAGSRPHSSPSTATRRAPIHQREHRHVQKRGGDQVRVDVDLAQFSYEGSAADADPDALLALDEAMSRLKSRDIWQAKAVDLATSPDSTLEEAAEVLDLAAGAATLTPTQAVARARARLGPMLFSYGNPRSESRSNPMDTEATHPRSTHRFIPFAAGGEKALMSTVRFVFVRVIRVRQFSPLDALVINGFGHESTRIERIEPMWRSAL